ncbi:MAG: ATP-binding cassette domain-containing protein [Bacteroidetes bacterium]|jgi:ABC-2 type transport system ATP-binding protein|nr:ATP-binding cassette domain-containing protein [Bacteroidota bacterium]
MTVTIDALTKVYGAHFRLEVPSLRIDAGETFGLVGNNGAGKTTVLRLLLDLIAADAGTVRMGDTPVHAAFDWKQRVSSYLDDGFLIDFLMPVEFFQFVGAQYGLDAATVPALLTPYESFLPQEAFSAHPPLIRDLSMGNKKKVGIVAALLPKPDVLVLDEPFANLDPGSQIRLKDHLRTLNRETGTTLILSSHDLAHVTDVCQRIAVLEDGRIVRDLQTSEATLDELHRFFASEA